MAGPVQMNAPGIEKNERLEHVELYENGRQIDMREWMEKL